MCGFTITGGKGNINPPNSAYDAFGGGGIAVGRGAGAKIHFNKITNNNVSYNNLASGGGIIIEAPANQVVVENNYITNNSVISFAGHAFGAGVLCVNNPTQLITIANNVITNNKVLTNSGTLTGGGGGIYLDYSNPFIRNNLIKNNKASNGGGIQFINYPGSNNPAIVNNTIVSNEASEEGGGVGRGSEGSNPQIINSIVWGNTASSDPQIQSDTGGVSVSYSNVEGGFSGTGNIDQDPLFADTIDYYLSSNSPSVDAGFPYSGFNDVEDPNNPGSPLFPALGERRNDMGHCGGNPLMMNVALPEAISSLRIDDDINGVPDRKDEIVTTSGVVTSINFQKSSGNSWFLHTWTRQLEYTSLLIMMTRPTLK